MRCGAVKRNVFPTIIFISIGLLLIIAVFLRMQDSSQNLVYDDEQNGLNDQIVIKFSHVVAENTPKGLAAQHFANIVQKKTKNQVKVEVFPNGILYSDQEEIEALRQGAIQMIAPATSKLSDLFPEWQLIDLPFAFSSYDAVNEAFTGEIGQKLLALVEQEGFKGLGFWANGFKQITSNKGPIINPEDLNGQHFRIMPSNVLEKQFQLLGVKTKKTGFNQTFQNLESGELTGQENSLSNIYTKKFYRVQQHLTISNHGFLGYGIIMNGEFWDKLPVEIQDDILEALEDTSEWIQRNSKNLNEASFENIKKDSTISVHILTNSEKKEWKKVLLPVYQEFESVIGKDLMEKLYDLQQKYKHQNNTFQHDPN